MKNADEHKKLLAQIKELEKNSINYFDVEKEFFLIDSNNLSQVRPKIYGYSIQATGIYEDDNLTAEAVKGLDGRGCYVYVDVKDGAITIKQDVNGCWGIYLFRHGDYFALSNSFFRLLDHVKFKYPLTVNRDYCHYMLLALVSSHTYSETPITEISLIDRNTILHIDLKTKNFEILRTKFIENSISPDSQEGIDILDRWVKLWGDVFSGVAQNTNFVSVDLSGGFDSRITFVPVLHSGVDLNKVRINSSTSTLHTYKEDYAIATKIAEHYGFKLNQSFPPNPPFDLTLSDVFNINLYYQQAFRAIPTFSFLKRLNKAYGFGGNGGETIRNYWYMSPQKFIDEQTGQTKRYSRTLSSELSYSIETLLKNAFRAIQEKYGIQDQDSPYLSQYLYKETRCRHHFGKFSLIEHFFNAIRCSPVMDPGLMSLRLNTQKCPDSNLLMALIFTRYEPDLLKFPFNSNHSIKSETIEYAQKINERFPLRIKDVAKETRGGVFYLQPRDLQAEKILASGRKNKSLPANLPPICLKAMFESSRTYGLFTTYFDSELYHYAASFCETGDVYVCARPIYAVMGIAKVLEAVEISQHNRFIYDGMKNFIEQDFVKIHNAVQMIDKFKPFTTARVDIRFISKGGDFQIISVSDEKANVTKPAWFNENGIGYVIQSYAGELKIVAKATVDGQILLYFRGVDIRTPEDKSKRVPYWLDYTKFILNGKIIFDKLTPAWHDEPYVYQMDVKAGEELKINVEWLPHRSDT